ncbi:ABC transporter ATP-binding protein [Sporosarcina sp. Marseille-Q4063]|uniref:ABC transporter ATP-binding protein n=1 Tax=Sporosarcina sp. Marseille-Q4063 TaxID=2810514 RepID=UPI003530028C
MLTVENVSKTYRDSSNVKQVLCDIDLTVGDGEIVGLVGESGSGKSTLARMIMQLEKRDAGSIYMNEVPVTKSKAFYEDCQLIFQNASAALNPSWTVHEILREPLRDMKTDRDAYIFTMLGKVKLSKEHLKKLPSELSGGERQRVNLLRSVLVRPKLLICDEIVSNLDRLIQKEIIDLLIEINRETGMAMLFIAHDLKVVTYMCNRIYVMKNGEIVDESSKVDHQFTFLHPYSNKLFRAMLGSESN